MKAFSLARLLFLALFVISSEAATHFVFMPSGNRFDPRLLTIDQGDTVIWTNRTSTRHDTVSFDNVWRSPEFGLRGSFSFTFNVPPGNYDYYCTPHLDVGMTGTITVRGTVNTPPAVSITSPANAATFNDGAVTVQVTAADADGSVASVQLLANNSPVATDTSPPYEFNLVLGAGTHTLAARATDNGGAQTTSTPITITVAGPNQPPTVTLTAPPDGSAFTAPADLTLTATASDDRGVSRVEFLVNDNVVGQSATEPYTLQQIFAAGTYRISARAYDTDGLSATSPASTIQVNDPLPEFPTVSIHSPAPEDYVTLAPAIELMATATDANGSIATVEFREGETSLGFATRQSATMFTLATALAEGQHTLTAIATDNTGNATTSNPVTFFVVLEPEFTSRQVLTNGVVRLSVFGTSGIPFVFERSPDGLAWTPFLTNSLVRRILFFDDEAAAGQPKLIYRARSPEPVAPAAGAKQINDPFCALPNRR